MLNLKYRFRRIFSVGVICDVDKSNHCQALDERRGCHPRTQNEQHTKCIMAFI